MAAIWRRIRRCRKGISALDSKRIQILEECLLEWRSEFRQRNAGAPRALNRLVVDVRDVHHAMHLEPAQLEMPLEQIFENVSAEISDVRVAVDRRSAGVHLHFASRRIERMKFLERAGVGVEESKRH